MFEEQDAADMKKSPALEPSEIGPGGAADFLSSAPGSAVQVNFDITSSARFFDRELSWICFDERVLEEAENPVHPLLERLRFLAISGENLDEFHTVRVAGLRGLVRSGSSTRHLSGISSDEYLHKINAHCRRIEESQQEVWQRLRKALREAAFHVCEVDELGDADRRLLDDYFLEQVLPLLTPLAVDPAHPFPFIPNKGLVLAINLVSQGDGSEGEESLNALLPIPSTVERFVQLPPGPRPEVLRFLPVENLILHFISRLFPGYVNGGAGLFRVLRDSDIEIEEEAEDLVREFEIALKRRRRGEVIRLTIEAGAPVGLKSRIAKELGVPADDIVEAKGMIGLADLAGLASRDCPNLQWQTYTPRMPERIRDHNGDIFGAVRQKDMLVHHPYESFETVVRFLRQAARDPDVVTIKQTLYRTSEMSPIVEALCGAAEAGKSVTAVVELKARFDEATNIRLARQLERAGVQVVFGFVEWKTHAKISLIIRREGNSLISYTHFGTGNYHPITARIYTDLSLFSCDPALGRDTARLFNYITGYALVRDMEQVAVAPINMKTTLLGRIEEEAGHARAGRPAVIWAKLNALIHPEIIDALYAASSAGVRVDLVVRGICGLRPGVAGLSENIRVKSIVGRFLEHSRIVCFGAGGGLPGKDARIYISSADWMERNLERRIETLVEIRNTTVRAQIIDQIMAANLRDEAQSWLLRPDGTYERYSDRPEAKDRDLFCCHDFFMQHPSLSGRGRSGVGDVPRLT